VKIGIVVALPEELETITPIEFKWGECKDISSDLSICLSGAGSLNAFSATLKLLNSGAEAVISWGTATGLISEIHAGDLIIPRRVIDDRRKSYTIDQTITDVFLRRMPGNITLHRSSLAGNTQLLNSREAKIALKKKTRAIAADMESATIVHLAHEKGVPALVIRAITDDLNISIPGAISENLDIQGRLNKGRMFARLIASPAQVPQFIKVARGFGKAKYTLTMVAPQLQKLLHEDRTHS